MRVLQTLRVTLTRGLCSHTYRAVSVTPHPLYVEIGKRIKARRKALENLKQEALAKQLGISRGSLANIETGRQKILVHQLYRYAAVLGLQPLDLLPPPDANEVIERTELPITAEVNQQQRKQIEQLFHSQISIPAKSRQEVSHVQVTKR